MSFGKRKPIIIRRPDDTEVEYCSQSEAARHEPLNQSDISEMCRLGISRNGYKATWKPDVQTESSPEK